MDSIRNSPATTALFEFAGFRLDGKKRLLLNAEGEPIDLTARAFDTLLCLLEHHGETVSRQQIIDAVWPNSVIEENNLNQAISAVRKALGDHHDKNKIIVTIPGRGYSLVADIAYPNGSAAIEMPGSPVLQKPERKPSIPLIGSGLALVLLVFAIINLYPVNEEIVDKSIAVLPFTDLSERGDQKYFSDGLSEELMYQLAEIEGLRVAGRTSNFSIKGANEDLPGIGEKLNVAHILEGSVRKDGDQLRITAQLINTADGFRLWSQTYDRRLDDVFAIQLEIAVAVADALSVTLGVEAASLALGGTENIEAYDRYLRARALYNGAVADRFDRAVDLFHEVIALDPDFARARAGLAATLVEVRLFFPERQLETIAALEEARADALAHAPDNWATHFVSATLHRQRHEWADADRAFTRATELSPGSAFIGNDHWGSMLLGSGQTDDAIAILETSVRIDPLSRVSSILLEQALTIAGRSEEAEAEYQRSQDLPGGGGGFDFVALMRVWNGADADLIAARYERFAGDPSVPPLWAEVRSVLDDPDAALSLIRSAQDEPAYQDWLNLWLIGLHASRYGDTELALKVLRRDFVEMRQIVIFPLWFPDMRAARRDPGFKDIVRDLGLVDYWRETGNWGDHCRPLGSEDFECF
jgi:TolB-like protein/DNA-binding winged helix-turn-helix (wHTH) protein